MKREAGADADPALDSAAGVEAEVLPRVVRHRRHRSPARDKVVKVRYEEREHAVLVAAAGRAGLTVAGFLADAGLSVAGQGPPPSQAADRELLGELLRLRRRRAQAPVPGLRRARTTGTWRSTCRR